MPRSLAIALCAIGISITTSTAKAIEQSLATIEMPRGVKQSFILLRPKNPTASLILFAGGKGALGLKSATSMTGSRRNFLVRTRRQFAQAGFQVAVMDTPADRPRGLSVRFRLSRAHAGDIRAVARHLKKLAAVPVWVVGTSMGTLSAANAAIALKDVDGLVLSSTVTRSPSRWATTKSHPEAVASMNLPKIKVPTLILAHRDDQCHITPAADSGKLRARLTGASRVRVATLIGGLAARSKPCRALSAHGFYGIEERAVATIAKFIKTNRR